MPEYDADKDDAPLWQLMVGIHRELSGMVFESVGNDQSMSVSQEAIVIRKAGADQETVEELLPGVIISLPSQNATPWEAGTNVEVESRYPILIQIVVPDLNDKVAGMRSALKWQNMMCRRLSAPNLELVDVDTDGVGFEISQTTSVFNIDKKTFALHKGYVCGVIVECLVRETWTREE